MNQLVSRVGSQLVAKKGAASFSTTSIVGRGVSKGEVHPGYLKIREKYKIYQADDGVPIHLKRGAPDKALFGFTIFLCAVGLFECGRYYYTSAFPPKPA